MAGGLTVLDIVDSRFEVFSRLEVERCRTSGYPKRDVCDRKRVNG